MLNLPNLLDKKKKKKKKRLKKKVTITSGGSKTDRSNPKTNRSGKSKYKIKTVLNTKKKVARPENISSSESSTSSEDEVQGNPFKNNFDIDEPFISKLTMDTRKLYINFLIYHSALKFSGVKLKKFMAYF